MVRFSIVYPTRNRSQFVETGLRCLTQQTNKDFEVVVSDNPSSENASVEALCKDFGGLEIVYARAPRELSMSENWNHALSFCSGDYVLYLTDKMMLLPQTLERIRRAFEESGSKEIVSWPSDSFNPDSFDRYFGSGNYYAVGPDFRQFNGSAWREYAPMVELQSRLDARQSRLRQSKRDYARGKIVFGAYDINLIRRITEKHGRLFWPLSPDYTSMVLALGTASSAIELQHSGAVSVNTDISNGGLNAKDDNRTLDWISSELNGECDISQKFIIPGLYSSQHATVSADYTRMLAKLESPLKPCLRNWVKHCFEDFNEAGRTWSSPKVQAEQWRTYRNFVKSMSVSDRIVIISFELFLPSHRILRKLLGRAVRKNRLVSFALKIAIPRLRQTQHSVKKQSEMFHVSEFRVGDR